jgi:hypothetical protein
MTACFHFQLDVWVLTCVLLWIHAAFYHKTMNDHVNFTQLLPQNNDDHVNFMLLFITKQ